MLAMSDEAIPDPAERLLRVARNDSEVTAFRLFGLRSGARGRTRTALWANRLRLRFQPLLAVLRWFFTEVEAGQRIGSLASRCIMPDASLSVSSFRKSVSS